MSNFLTEIRNKPDSQKKKILYISTSLVMVIVLVTWYLLSSVFGIKNESNKAYVNDVDLNNLKELYSDFTGQFEQIIDDLSN